MSVADFILPIYPTVVKTFYWNPKGVTIRGTLMSSQSIQYLLQSFNMDQSGGPTEQPTDVAIPRPIVWQKIPYDATVFRLIPKKSGIVSYLKIHMGSKKSRDENKKKTRHATKIGNQKHKIHTYKIIRLQRHPGFVGSFNGTGMSGLWKVDDHKTLTWSKQNHHDVRPVLRCLHFGVKFLNDLFLVDELST